MTTEKFPEAEVHEVPLPAIKDIIPEPPAHLHPFMPLHDETAKIAHQMWEDEGGGWTTQAEADANWFAAEDVLRARHRA